MRLNKVYKKLSFVFFVSYLFIASPGASAEDLPDYLQKGDKAHDSFDNVTALDMYQKAYELNPKSFEVTLKLAMACIDVGEDIDSKESEPYFERAAQLSEELKDHFPEHYYTYTCLALSYGYLALHRGGKEKVKLSGQIVENAKKAIELKPDYDVPYIVLGSYYREVANLSPFLKAFAEIFLGNIPNGSNEESLACLEKASQLNPDFINTYFEMAKTYQSMRQPEKISECLALISEKPISDHLDSHIKFQASAWAGAIDNKPRSFARRNLSRHSEEN